MHSHQSANSHQALQALPVPQAHPAAQHMELLTPARLPDEELRPQGLGISPGPNASEGQGRLRALNSIPLETPPFPPTPGLSLTFQILTPSSSQCYTMPLPQRWQKAGPWKEGDKENQKCCEAALGFAESWLYRRPAFLSSPSASCVRAVPCPCCFHGTSCLTEPARLSSSSLLPLLNAAQEDLLFFPRQSIPTPCRSPPAVPALTLESLWHLQSHCFG